ncbi:hypothetical protein B566_EDAN016721, partial [Ephemera danica]
MALKRKKVAPPLFYDVESNTLYPEGFGPKKRKCDDVCRICAERDTLIGSNELIDMYGEHGKSLSLSAQVNRFLPIEVKESDGLSHWICLHCRTILLKMDNLYSICQKTDAYFTEQMHGVEPIETEMVEVKESDGLSHWICLHCRTILLKMDNLYSICEKTDAYFTEQMHGVEPIETEMVEEFDAACEDLIVETSHNFEETSPTEPDTSKTGNIGFTVFVEEPIFQTHSFSFGNNEELNINLKLPTSEPEIYSFSITEEESTVEISNLVDNEKLSNSELPTFEHDNSDDLITEDFVSDISDPEEEILTVTTTKSNSAIPTATKVKNIRPTATKSKTKSAKPTKTKRKNTKAGKSCKINRCDLCGDMCMSIKQFKTHMKEQHQKFVCYKCLATFDDHSDYKEHLHQENHGKICNICNKEFNDVNKGKSHASLHYIPVKVVISTGKENHKTVETTGVPVEINELVIPIQNNENISNTSKTFPFQCHFCNKEISNSTEATHHYKEHEMHLCSFCFNHFPNRKSLRRHMVHKHPKKVSEFNKQHNINKQALTCTICFKEYLTLFSIKNHYLEFHQKYFCCPCKLLFDTPQELDTHSLEVHSCNASFSHQCSACGKNFESEESLAFHMKNGHENPAKRYYCDKCAKSYVHKDTLKEHILKVHEKIILKGDVKVLCEFCNKYMAAKRIEKHKISHKDDKQFICIHCDATFPSVYKLQIHFQSNHEVNVVKCPECQIQLDKNELKKHLEEEHTTEWTYICKKCNLNYKTDTEIWQHCTTEHGIKQDPTSLIPYLRTSPHQCKICFEYLANAFKLKKHKHNIRTHSNSAVKVICDLCGEAYSKYSKASHMYAKHNKPLPNQCNVCGRSFKSLKKKINHVSKFHDDEKRKIICEICKLCFPNLRNMLRHKSAIHGKCIKLFPCPYCPQKLKQKSSLQDHMRVHAANIPYR